LQAIKQTRKKCRDAMNDVNFIVELAAASDIGRHFVNACHFLEGDGFLSPRAYDVLSGLLELDQNWYHPTLTAVCKQEVANRFPHLVIPDQIVRENLIFMINISIAHTTGHCSKRTGIARSESRTRWTIYDTLYSAFAQVLSVFKTLRYLDPNRVLCP
jgi:hypothetical protein